VAVKTFRQVDAFYYLWWGKIGLVDPAIQYLMHPAVKLKPLLFVQIVNVFIHFPLHLANRAVASGVLTGFMPRWRINLVFIHLFGLF
jgi:hypothetical protein